MDNSVEENIAVCGENKTYSYAYSMSEKFSLFFFQILEQVGYIVTIMISKV
jgi:hypothetical protein